MSLRRLAPPLAALALSALCAAAHAQPPGRFIVPADRIARACVALMARDGVHVDDASCPRGMPAFAGSRLRCVARQGRVTAGVSVTMRAWDPATKNADLLCRVDRRALSRR